MLVLASRVTGCVSISVFPSLDWVLFGVLSSTVGTKICAVTAWIKKYQSIIKNEKKKYGKTVLLGEMKEQIKFPETSLEYAI